MKICRILSSLRNFGYRHSQRKKSITSIDPRRGFHCAPLIPSDIIDIDNLSEPSEPSVILHYECERTVTLAFLWDLWGLKLNLWSILYPCVLLDTFSKTNCQPMVHCWSVGGEFTTWAKKSLQNKPCLMVALFWIDRLIHLTYQPPVYKVFDIVRDFGDTNW